MKTKFYRLSILFTIFFTVLVSCNKEDVAPVEPTPLPEPEKVSPDYSANLYLRKEYMDQYYYWADDVKGANAKLDLKKYEIYDAFDAMLYKDDRWSWMESGESFRATESGEISGTWGVSWAQREDYVEAGDYSVYVCFILPESPLAKKGVTRGAKLTGIKGLKIPEDGFHTQEQIDYFNEHLYDSPQTFEFKLPNGEKISFEATLPKSVSTNFILSEQIFDGEDFPGLDGAVGYFNLYQFESAFKKDIDAAFSRFKEAGVKKMIVDLRYNSGGSADVCQRMISYLAPVGLNGKPYVTRTHNNLLSSLNETQYIGEEKSSSYRDMSIGLDEIYFIMDHGSASSSEVLYNGLRPYLKDKIHMVGRQTYGKPNGMYVLFYPGDDKSYEKYNSGDYSLAKWVFYPICFFNKNSAGESIPYGPSAPSGFLPDNERPDDILHDFGVEEDRIKACLTHIVSGNYPEVPVTKNTKAQGNGLRIPSLEPEWKTNPNYGSYFVR